jgi:hypothetical protein
MTRPPHLFLIAHLLAFATCSLTVSAAAQEGRTLRPFSDETEIEEFHQRLLEEQRRRWANVPPPTEGELMNRGHTTYPPPPVPDLSDAPRQQERPIVSREAALRAAQETGGDPRETVQATGEHLVVLRRGRLFAFRADEDTLQLVSSVDAAGFPVRSLMRYDELLVSGRHAVVVGTSMEHDGTELELFHLAPDGRLTHRARYSLRSGDDIAYHTYAARLSGGRLVLYTPLRALGPETLRPALHRWRARGGPTSQHASATRVYRPAGPVEGAGEMELHTVAACDLADDGEMQCAFTGLYAPPGSALHVSATAVYLWTAHSDSAAGSVLYRLPLDGSAPTALRVFGQPEGPSWFMESADGHLNVLLRSTPDGYASVGILPPSRLALLRVPLSEFGDGSRAAPRERYRALPSPGAGALGVGFVGDWLIYGLRANRPSDVVRGPAIAVRWADGSGASHIDLPHAVERVEALGPGALLVGGDGDSLHLSTLRLGRDTAMLVDRHAIRNWGMDSPAVAYRADGPDTGVLAVPVRGSERPRGTPVLYGRDRIRFVRNRGLRLEPMGEVAAGAFPGDDACLRGCRIWFGDTRAVFHDGRILALLGYEVVEAAENAGSIHEVRRAGFMPTPPTADLSGEWTFAETIGNAGSPYYCRNQGTMRLDRAGDSLTVRYRQTGECTIDGATTRSDGEGTATGRIEPAALTFESGPCRYAGHMDTLHSMDGSMECRIPMPDGSTRNVSGLWSMERTPP